jgi:hypothetical protein
MRRYLRLEEGDLLLQNFGDASSGLIHGETFVVMKHSLWDYLGVRSGQFSFSKILSPVLFLRSFVRGFR